MLWLTWITAARRYPGRGRMRNGAAGDDRRGAAGPAAPGDGVPPALAGWAAALDPSPADLELARRSLVDTVAVALAARDDPVAGLLDPLGPAGRWSALAHVLDFDDLHMPSTAHISAICVPVALATRRRRAGVPGRRRGDGAARGRRSGGRTTPAAGTRPARRARRRRRPAPRLRGGAGAEEIATAMALAVPAAGGVQRAFGTAGEVAPGRVRGRRRRARGGLAAAGASADPAALDQWLALRGRRRAAPFAGGPAVPDGLAMKLFPCCYALQRPMRRDAGAARAGGRPGRSSGSSSARRLRPSQPLIHDRPVTGLQGKFSLRHGVAAALLDEHPGFAAFTDAGVGVRRRRRCCGG